MSFEFQGVEIDDPTLDETGRFPVDPDYYHTTVMVPTLLLARVKGGKVVALRLLPKEGDAGYFGPPSEVVDGPDLDMNTFWDELMPAIFNERGLVAVDVEWEG